MLLIKLFCTFLCLIGFLCADCGNCGCYYKKGEKHIRHESCVWSPEPIMEGNDTNFLIRKGMTGGFCSCYGPHIIMVVTLILSTARSPNIHGVDNKGNPVKSADTYDIE